MNLFNGKEMFRRMEKDKLSTNTRTYAEHLLIILSKLNIIINEMGE